MTKHADHAHRRAEIADALWRVAERDGIDAVTVRRVAAEAGVSAGRVQHYFATKNEMLLFALRSVGDEFGDRLTRQVRALPEPRDPRRVIHTVLVERLPLRPQSRIFARALGTWLSSAPETPEAGDYLREGTRVLRDHLAEQVRAGQAEGRIPAAVSALTAADGLLAVADGLALHLLQNLHRAQDAVRVVDAQLDLLFGESPADRDH